ncbi:ANTAR domain-containing protein [Streptomyces sp. NPDC052114]|uniref:ANTAR domain-containing protein n=1 Tax=unclassified Streptomyces TaxID=2593676 RepID=UPI00344958B8
MEFLQDLTVRCVDLLGVSGAVVLLESGAVEASDERTRALEVSAVRQGEGPCLESCRSGVAMMDVDIGGAESVARWPRYAEQARAAGFVALQVLPLRQETPAPEDAQAVGALGLFHAEDAEPVVGAQWLAGCAEGADRAGSLSEDRVAFAQTLADLAAAAVLRQQSLERSLVERGQLQSALTSRIAVEQAKGVLAERWRCSVDEAFSALRAYARSRRLRLAEVARQVVAGEDDAVEIRRRWAEEGVGRR